MKKFATLAAVACAILGLALAGPVPCEVRGQDPLNPDCACGPDCPCKAAAKAAAAKQTAEPPRAGHWVTVCDGRSCHQVFVPDATAQTPTVQNWTVESFALPPAKFYQFRGSPTYTCDDGTVTETRVAFRHRGPLRRLVFRR